MTTNSDTSRNAPVTRVRSCFCFRGLNGTSASKPFLSLTRSFSGFNYRDIFNVLVSAFDSSKDHTVILYWNGPAAPNS